MFFLIVGLGNPDPQYLATRHNAGFQVVDRLAVRHRIGWQGSDWEAQLGHGRIGVAPVLLLKPLTYMNRSGEAVLATCRHFGVGVDRLAVIHDDLDLVPGRLQVRRGGGAGGHRGLDSILAVLGEREFVRFRVGIGRPAPGEQAADYVLKPPGEAERAALSATAERCADAVETWLRTGLTLTMNQFNPFPERESEE